MPKTTTKSRAKKAQAAQGDATVSPSHQLEAQTETLRLSGEFAADCWPFLEILDGLLAHPANRRRVVGQTADTGRFVGWSLS